jgi:hypothetical protein
MALLWAYTQAGSFNEISSGPSPENTGSSEGSHALKQNPKAEPGKGYRERKRTGLLPELPLPQQAQIDKREGWLILFRRYCPSTAKPETNCRRLTPPYAFLSRPATHF